MVDIVERLRNVQWLVGATFSSQEVAGLAMEAADEIRRVRVRRDNLAASLAKCEVENERFGQMQAEIERLRAENAGYRAVLRFLAGSPTRLQQWRSKLATRLG